MTIDLISTAGLGRVCARHEDDTAHEHEDEEQHERDFAGPASVNATAPPWLPSLEDGSAQRLSWDGPLQTPAVSVARSTSLEHDDIRRNSNAA
jgi:hypothetical protein